MAESHFRYQPMRDNGYQASQHHDKQPNGRDASHGF
jgi:hypothetical protein